MKTKTLSLAAGFAALLFVSSSIASSEPVISSSSENSVRISDARVVKALGGGSYSDLGDLAGIPGKEDRRKNLRLVRIAEKLGSLQPPTNRAWMGATKILDLTKTNLLR